MLKQADEKLLFFAFAGYCTGIQYPATQYKSLAWNTEKTSQTDYHEVKPYLPMQDNARLLGKGIEHTTSPIIHGH